MTHRSFSLTLRYKVRFLSTARSVLMFVLSLVFRAALQLKSRRRPSCLRSRTVSIHSFECSPPPPLSSEVEQHPNPVESDDDVPLIVSRTVSSISLDSCHTLTDLGEQSTTMKINKSFTESGSLFNIDFATMSGRSMSPPKDDLENLTPATTQPALPVERNPYIVAFEERNIIPKTASIPSISTISTGSEASYL